jgi:hypothetical protein
MGRKKKKVNGDDAEAVLAAGLEGSPVDEVIPFGDADHETNGVANGVSPAATTLPPEPPKRTRYLMHKLTLREKRLAGKALARELGKLDELDLRIADLQEALKRRKQEKENIIQDARLHSIAIREGEEMRNVECEEREAPEYAAGAFDEAPGRDGVETIRLDTGERIEWRPLTTSERQGSLFSEVSP